jgi:hypothetical protein
LGLSSALNLASLQFSVLWWLSQSLFSSLILAVKITPGGQPQITLA